MTMKIRLILPGVVALAAMAMAVVVAPTASATTLSIPSTPTTIANYPMQETAGSVMTDVSAGRHNATIGSLVTVGQVMGDGQLGYLFPGGSAANPTHSNLAIVKATSYQNPGAGDFHLQYTIQTTQTTEANFVQKGQAGAGGGFYKAEMTGGLAGCYFSGSLMQREAWSTVKINDGKVHTVDCYKTDAYVEVVVDNANPVKAWGNTGSVNNWADLSVGGKETCTKNADGSPNCDYFAGYLRTVTVAVGPETS